MAILGGKFTNDDDDGGGGGDAVTLPLDDVVCSICNRDLAPWMTVCPDDGGAPMSRSDSMLDGPTIPAHLLDGLEEAGDLDDADGMLDDATDRGVHDDGDDGASSSDPTSG